MQVLEDAVFWGGVKQEIKGLDPRHTGSAVAPPFKGFQREK